MPVTPVNCPTTTATKPTDMTKPLFPMMHLRPASSKPGGYLRDDELNYYLNQIRAALGPAGSLWLLFDSCHSQTLNRGHMAQRTRGGTPPMGKPAALRSKRSGNGHMPSGSDWYEPMTAPSKRAPYVLFAATTDNGPNFETTDVSGRSFGPLTRAVCEVWNDRKAGETHRNLFTRM